MRHSTEDVSVRYSIIITDEAPTKESTLSHSIVRFTRSTTGWMMSDVDRFPESMWAHHGDRSSRQRVLRVLDYHDGEYWMQAGAIKFVEKREYVVDDIERALDGATDSDDVELVEASDQGLFSRFRIDINRSDDA